MKNTMKFFVLVALVFAAFTVSAQTKPVRLGYVNTQELLAAMPEVKAAEAKMMQKRQEIEKQLADLRGEYQRLVKEYEAGVKSYTEMARAAKEQEIQALVGRIQQYEATASESMQKAQEELFTPILAKARQAIKAVGDENGFTYIFDASALLYTSPTGENVLPLVKKKLGIQ